MIVPSAPHREMNSVLTADLFPFGMFCKFGSLLLNRPVTVEVWLILWWMMPSSPTMVSMPFGSPSLPSLM
jgi:hypothetical protein